MYREDKMEIRRRLRRYGERNGVPETEREQAEFERIRAALERMRSRDPEQARLLELRYLRRNSVEAVMDALYLGHGGASYRRMDIEALSTLALEIK